MNIESKMDEVAASLLARLTAQENIFKGDVGYAMEKIKRSLRESGGKALHLVSSGKDHETMGIGMHADAGVFEIIPTLSELVSDEGDRRAFIKREEEEARAYREQNEQPTGSEPGNLIGGGRMR